MTSTMPPTLTMSDVTKSAQEALAPYLGDKAKLVSIAKTLQDSHYALLTNHADLSRSIQSMASTIKEKRSQAMKVLDDYNHHKLQLADLVDKAVGYGASSPLVQGAILATNITPETLQSSIDKVKFLADHIQSANDHINTLKDGIQQKTSELGEVASTKSQNAVLSQMIQTALQGSTAKQ